MLSLSGASPSRTSKSYALFVPIDLYSIVLATFRSVGTSPEKISILEVSNLFRVARTLISKFPETSFIVSNLWFSVSSKDIVKRRSSRTFISLIFRLGSPSIEVRNGIKASFDGARSIALRAVIRSLGSGSDS